jgi:hypothetical protein
MHGGGGCGKGTGWGDSHGDILVDTGKLCLAQRKHLAQDVQEAFMSAKGSSSPIPARKVVAQVTVNWVPHYA